MANKSKKAPSSISNLINNIFNYTSICCNAPATKAACAKSDKADSSLGKWKCVKCSQKCKVTRSKYKKEDNVEQPQSE